MRLVRFGWFYFGKIWKNGRFSGRIWPDWGNTARADMAGLWSIGLRKNCQKFLNRVLLRNSMEIMLFSIFSGIFDIFLGARCISYRFYH